MHLFFTENALNDTVGCAGREVLKNRATYSEWYLLGLNVLMLERKLKDFNLIEVSSSALHTVYLHINCVKSPDVANKPPWTLLFTI